MDKRFKWSRNDNVIAQAELKLARILTEEMNRRPEVSLRALFQSKVVHDRVAPVLVGLELKVGKKLKTQAESTRERDGKRRAWVEIVPE
jgi:hypothetical protein